MGAYYNEIDPKAAAWLRELIKQGHIADGVVDERSIIDVRPDELTEFTQCNFFAGLAVWSYALRSAGWDDDRPVWTGSCPCQPFSAAGARGGFDDQRHLWPHWHHLISQCRPPIVFGEQVASKDGLGWLDLVCADMEATGYAIGAADLCAAGVGAPHIRQRLWFVGLADAEHTQRWQVGEHRKDGCDGSDGRREEAHGVVGTRSEVFGLADADNAGPQGHGQSGRLNDPTEWQYAGRHGAEGGVDGGLADASRSGWGEELADIGRSVEGSETREVVGHAGHSAIGGMADADSAGRIAGERDDQAARHRHPASTEGIADQHGPTRPTNGFWRDADWLFCRDGKWRPVESGTFPLANGSAARVGRLRGYGNAIAAPVAQTFIKSVMDII